MPGSEIADGLLQAATETLRPLVLRLLRAGVPFGQLESRLRTLYVAVAEHELQLPGRRQTVSRLALLTGINRKEVKRLRAAPVEQAAAPGSFGRNLAASLISRWLQDRRATDRAGRARPIPYRAARGPSFVKLALATTADLPPRALLDALVESGAAVVRADGRVALTGSAYVPRRTARAKLAMLAEDPAELVATMLHNVLDETDETRLQLKVAYDNLGADGLPRLRKQLRREGARFVRRVDRLLAGHDRDRNARAPGGERSYAGLGLYYFERPVVPGKAKK